MRSRAMVVGFAFVATLALGACRDSNSGVTAGRTAVTDTARGTQPATQTGGQTSAQTGTQTGTTTGSGTAASSTTTTRTVNGVPVISGSPPTAVVPGRAYTFKPSAHDPEGVRLLFNIRGQPRWASFDLSTGTLAGTPGTNDVGEYDNILISVTDGTYYVALPQFKVAVVGTATGSINLNWTPPTLRDDGSPLVNLAGYKLYWGTSAGNYPNSARIDNPGVASYLIDQLTPGTYYVVATAFDAQGIESGYSNMVSKTVTAL